MGLYIAREVLRRVDYDLSLTKRENERGATFVIAPVSENTERIK